MFNYVVFWGPVLAPVFVAATAILLSLWATLAATYEEVQSIKDGASVVVQHRSFTGGSAGQVSSELKLIGATQKVVIFYDVDEKESVVIPQAQIVSIEVPADR